MVELCIAGLCLVSPWLIPCIDELWEAIFR